MSSKIDRAQKLPSSKTTVESTSVEVKGFAELIAQLKAITVANQKSQKDLVASIDQLSKVIILAGEEGMDTDNIVEAITGLKDLMASKKSAPMLLDYTVDFERDKYGLMKTGIRMRADQRKLN